MTNAKRQVIDAAVLVQPRLLPRWDLTVAFVPFAAKLQRGDGVSYLTVVLPVESALSHFVVHFHHDT
jgi:hypothetical protein